MSTKTDLNSAAVSLTLHLFGELATFHRRGHARAGDGALHVYTIVPPERWSPDRPRNWEGFPVTWHCVGPKAPVEQSEFCDI